MKTTSFKIRLFTVLLLAIACGEKTSKKKKTESQTTLIESSLEIEKTSIDLRIYQTDRHGTFGHRKGKRVF
jgi:hypothetical protein